MKKVTFSTLKKYARQGSLYHKVKGEYNGMYEGMEFYNGLRYKKTSLKDLIKFKVTKNWITLNEDNSIDLSNCCYSINFIIK